MEEEELNPTLKIIREAARQMAAERFRLNQVFNHLQSAVMSFDPKMYLTDAGELVRRDTIAPDYFIQPPSFVEVPGEANADHTEAQAEADREESDNLTSAKQRKNEIANFIFAHPGSTYNAVMKAFPLYNTKWFLDQLITENTVKKDSTGLLTHKNWRPQEASTEPAGTKGSGRRQDVSPGPTSRSTGTPTTNPPTPASGSTESTPGVSTSPSASSVSMQKTYGLARSPKPRDKMRPQQRGAEERMDKVVQWALTHGPTFENNTLARDESDLFSNSGQVGNAFRTLEERGVFVRTGKQVWPDFKLSLPVTKRGRTTAEYKFAEGFSVAAQQQAEDFKELVDSAPKA